MFLTVLFYHKYIYSSRHFSKNWAIIWEIWICSSLNLFPVCISIIKTKPTTSPSDNIGHTKQSNILSKDSSELIISLYEILYLLTFSLLSKIFSKLFEILLSMNSFFKAPLPAMMLSRSAIKILLFIVLAIVSIKLWDISFKSDAEVNFFRIISSSLV